MIAVGILLIVAAALAAVGCCLVRAPWSGWLRALIVPRPQRTSGERGQHRSEDANTGSLSATAILRALNAEAGMR